VKNIEEGWTEAERKWEKNDTARKGPRKITNQQQKWESAKTHVHDEEVNQVQEEIRSEHQQNMEEEEDASSNTPWFQV